MPASAMAVARQHAVAQKSRQVNGSTIVLRPDPRGAHQKLWAVQGVEHGKQVLHGIIPSMVPAETASRLG